MRLIDRIAAGARSIFLRSRIDHELDAELQFHLDQQIAELIDSGMSTGEARAAALRSIGSATAVKELCRDALGLRLLDEGRQDVCYAARTLRRNRGFAAVAIGTLALAMGASTTMFSVVNAVLLRPLPYRSPDQLAMLSISTRGQSLQGRPAYLTVEEWRRQSQSFADMAVFDPVSVTLTDAVDAEKVSVARISPNFLPLLGVHPILGRNFSDQDAEQRRHVALISSRFWHTRFGGAPDAIGASIELDGVSSEIVGILEMAQFNADIWEPHTLFPDWDTRRGIHGIGSWFVVGRLRPNVTVARAQAEMSALAGVLDDRVAESDRNRDVSVVPLNLYLVGPKSRLALWMLTGAVMCVLLIAAANVMSLSLARAASRAREIAIRAALGASTARIVRQLLTESVTVAVISGLLGTWLAVAGTRLIRAFGPRDLVRLNEVNLDRQVFVWAVVISLLTGVLVGLAPALAMLRRNLRVSSDEGGRTVGGGTGARRAWRGLVVTEFALAIILLASAGLLARSWWYVERVDPGFRPDGVLSLQLSTTALHTSVERTSFYNRVLEEVESLPDVESAGIVGDLFINGNSDEILTTDVNTGMAPQHVPLRRDEASPQFFTTIGTPLVKGRFFSAEDGPDSPRVVIINDLMARRVWPGRDPVGRRFKLGPGDSNNPWFTVVGVVGDVRRQGAEIEAIPQMFEPLTQNPSGHETLLVRTSVDDPLEIATSVEAVVRRVDKLAPLYGVTTLNDRLGANLAQRRFQTTLVIGFSVVALLMAAAGIYGLVHYSVSARTKEIGTRMAVGARAIDIFRMVIGEGLRLSATGLAVGLAGAFAVGRAGSSLLFGVAAADPLTFTLVSVLLMAVAIAASYLPARRAAKLDPLVALRSE